MSTTNINEQKMQQINSSDTITQFMEKCNNNFSNIFRYRSGPEGKQGVEGSQGVPTKPKVPIHVWREGVEYHSETISSNDGYVINDWKENLTDIKYQEGHLIMLKNGHVYILEEDGNSTLKPNYIMALQSYNQDDVIDGRSAYIHIAYANSTDDYYDFITNEELQKQENVGNGEIKYKYMGLYSNYEEESSPYPETYTWVRIVGDTGEKGDKGDKGDTPTSTSVEVVGYSLDDLGLDSKNWEKTISDLGELKPGTPIYILNKYTWDDGTVTYGKTVTMAGTQGIKGETGRVLFYLGSFKDGTLTGQTVKGRLNQYRCDYYIDINDIAWMRTGTPDDETSLEGREGSIFGNSNGDYKNYWTQSDKVGFLQANAISADMINVETLAANEAFITDLVANNAFIGKIVADEAFIKEIQATEISANKITTGRISSTNNNGVESYFDLDNGTFALGNALTYDGSGLSIKGVPDEDRIEEILTGLVGDIDIEIGGRNLLKNSKFTNLADGKTYDESTYWIYYPDSTYNDQYTLTVEDGHLKLTSTFASWGENWGEKTPRMGFYQTKENKSGQEYVLSFDAYADTPVYIKAASGYGSWNGENQRVQISKTKERYSIKMIGANGNATTGNISGYNIFFLRLDDKIQTSIYFDNFKLEEGTVATDWTPAPEDVDDAIAAVDSKTQSLDYLKEALANDTDIAGGIIATSTIQLRDWTGNYLSDGKTKEYKVNSGLSGIDNDNVLMWGGGTYKEAANAALADNDFHVGENKTGRQITSLLKTDGTGKIGCFHIDEDTIEVKPASGMPVTITTKSIDEYSSERNNGIITYEKSIGDKKSNGAGMYEETIASMTLPLNESVRLSVGNIIMGYELGSTGGSLYPYVEATLNVNAKNKNGTLVESYNTTMNDDDPVILLDDLVNRTFTNSGDITNSVTTIEISLTVKYFYGIANVRFDYILSKESDTQKCVFARDGLVISSGLNQRFIIKPNTDMLSIIADIPDLSTADTNEKKQEIVKSLEVGQLYTDSSGIVRRFSSEDRNVYFVEKFYKILEFESLFNILNPTLNIKRDAIILDGFDLIRGNFFDTNPDTD